MFDQLRANFTRFVELTDPEFAEFTAKMKPKTLEKNEFFLREGEVCNKAVFINTGCLRYFFTVDGMEKTGQFFFESTWYTDLESFLSGEPSEQNIQALETTQGLVIRKATNSNDLVACWSSMDSWACGGKKYWFCGAVCGGGVFEGE
jgi:CRP-like cAMP-binding protein